MDPETNRHTTGCDCDPFHLEDGIRMIAGYLPGEEDSEFPGPIEPGTIDKRVILQTTHWYDIHTQEHRLDDMTSTHRANVLDFLTEQTDSWTHIARATCLIAVILRFCTAPQTAACLEQCDTLPTGWIHHTPLGHRLHQLNQTQPPPLTPRLLSDASLTDRPDILRDTDNGMWQVTTRTGTRYHIDLNQRRIRRQPIPSHHDSAALDHDGEWLPLIHLVACTKGEQLFLLDNRAGTDGYRLSTHVQDIRGLPETGEPPRPPEGTPTKAASET